MKLLDRNVSLTAMFPINEKVIGRRRSLGNSAIFPSVLRRTLAKRATAPSPSWREALRLKRGANLAPRLYFHAPKKA